MYPAWNKKLNKTITCWKGNSNSFETLVWNPNEMAWLHKNHILICSVVFKIRGTVDVLNGRMK